MSPDELFARPGQSVRGALRRFAHFVRQDQVLQTGAGIRQHRSARGVAVIADARASAFHGAFAVALVGMEITVGPGTVDGVTPTIGTVPIDGITAEGKTVSIPRLKITGSPAEDLRSYVCIQARVDSKTRQLSETESDPLTIVQRASPSATDEEPLDENTGLLPISVLIWSADRKTISQVRQIVYFDQQLDIEESATTGLTIRFRAAS